ncbi:hypothetical protein RFI_08559 [Reticulomyxa filosa]|uniref:Tubulin beta chain n=1 Tax=Reticulomyxa filosa TaxID=46433 RepID=X6NRC2_RETFI|nr:hypothetical protein RFI_08559 [Reticulomyxa filosa]|eukprot:ETO28571.1 hypothetical protein RFI_08559 [Reticulomyxa filosa]
MEILRRELESSECPLAFSVGHSLSGGTGSGLGTLILTRLCDEFPDILRVSSSIFPSPGMAGDQNLAPFNSLCAFNMLAEFCDQVYLYDNSALNRCLSRYLKMEKPQLKDLNRLFAYVQCHITSPMRYPGKLSSDLRKMGTNLLPFPRLKFLGLSQSPICFEFDLHKESWSMAGPKKLSQHVLHPDNSLTSIDVESGKFLSSAMIWRGNMFTAEWETLGPELREKMSEYSVPWIPYNMQMIHARGGPIESNLSCTLIGNHTGIQNIFAHNIQNFNKFFKFDFVLFLFLFLFLDLIGIV